MTLSERIDAYLEYVKASNSESTLENYSLRLQRFERFVNGRRVTKALCAEYYIYLRSKEQLSARTVVIYRRCIRTFYNWLVDHELADSNPVGKLENVVATQAQRPIFTPEELDRITAKAKDDCLWSYAVLCGRETGLRLGDVATLRWDAILWDARGIKHMPNKTKRFQKTVEIPISETFLHKLTEMKLAAGDSPFVHPWMASEYQAAGHKTLSMQFIRLAEKASVFGKSFHCLRHTRATELLMSGMPAAVVCTITGHSLKELQTYCHPTLDDKRKWLQPPIPTHHDVAVQS